MMRIEPAPLAPWLPFLSSRRLLGLESVQTVTGQAAAYGYGIEESRKFLAEMEAETRRLLKL